MARGLNLKQLAFVKLYLGSDAALAGNASACYRVAYDSKAKRKTIHAMASTLMRNAKVRAVIDQATRKAVAAVDWSARTVLEESIRLYDRCMGDASYPIEFTTKDKKTGQITTSTVLRRSYNPQGARAALELIGRNTGIQAFQDNVEVSHTHYLEQALARRAKAVEGRAAALPALPGPAAGQDSINPVPGNDQGGPPDDTPIRSEPGHRQPGGNSKEGPSNGGQPNAGRG